MILPKYTMAARRAARLTSKRKVNSMQKYAILCHPGHNRVYYEAAKKLALAELTVLTRSLSVPCLDPQWEEIAGIGYVTFAAEAALSPVDWQLVSRLSFAYAMFAVPEAGALPCLHPVEKAFAAYMEDSFGSILKYTGKTNERFTRMLIQVAHAASGFAHEPCLRVLDPVAGKGTTLYEALSYGHHAYGIEVGERAAGDAYHYVKKYLETERYVHTAQVQKQSGPNKSFTATRYQFHIAKTRQEQKEGAEKILEIIAGNSVHARQFFPANYFHILVGDLPYGVQHGVVTQEKQSPMTRDPKLLLDGCLPAWREVLKPGGVAVFAWNRHVFSRDAMQDVLLRHRMRPLYPELDFSHRVDQAILRDVVIAQKA